jgi:hypothetical protein
MAKGRDKGRESKKPKAAVKKPATMVTTPVVKPIIGKSDNKGKKR